MGVVRREGSWRLEKVDEGLYEITYDREPQERIATPDYVESPMGDFGGFGLPVRKVDSYTEAEGLFEERAHGGPPAGFAAPAAGNPGSFSAASDPIESDVEAFDNLDDIEKVPPGALAAGLILIGGIFLWSNGLQTGSPGFLVGIGALVIGFGILGLAILMSDDIQGAVDYLATVQESDSGSNGEVEQTERTPPTPESLKNELYFDRADQKCEWCGEPIDQPEVHHIVPRNEGGPNEPSNLIVLCPNHHRKADTEAISRSKLKAKVRRQQD